MSVYLTIKWHDGRDESVTLGGYSAISENFPDLGAELDLQLVPRVHSFINVLPGNLEQFLNEFKMFREEMPKRRFGWESLLPVLNNVICALEKLQESDGWEAYFG